MSITGTIPPKEAINHAELKDMPDISGIETSHDARYTRRALAEAITGAWTFPTIVITDGAGHFLQVPKLTTAQRDALTAINGMIIYNITTAQFERYENGAWGTFGVSDHGLLTGLLDDDHTQYLNIARHDLTARHPLGTVVPHDALANLTEKAHSSLTGIGVSDHHVKTGDNEVYGLLAAGPAASRPAPGVAGRFYFSTDTLVLERDNGTGWDEMARGETAIRLAQLAERAHGSLTGIGSSDHHVKTTSGEIDHGSVLGLLDDDHPQYLKNMVEDTTPQLGGNLDAQDKNVRNIALIQFTDFTELTISGGVITVTQSAHSVDTEGDAAEDNLDTINGGVGGQILFLHPAAETRNIILKHGTGNIYLHGDEDIELDGIRAGIFLMCVTTVPPAVIWVNVTKMPTEVGWDLIESKILTSDVPSVSFENLSSVYNSFRMTCFIRRTDYGSPISTAIRLNDDAGPNYDWVDIQGNGTTASSSGGTGSYFGIAGAYDASHYGIAFIYFQNRLASVEKEFISFAGLGSDFIRNISNRWNNTTDLINKITVAAVIGNLLTGSQFILEGCSA